eukprot:6492214-Amphidinium_carterae.1
MPPTSAPYSPTLTAPSRPLSVHPKITRRDLRRREAASSPNLHQKAFGVSSITDDHRLLAVHLHVSLREALVHLPVRIAEVTCKTRSGCNQDHVINIFPHGNMSACTLKSLQKKGMK